MMNATSLDRPPKTNPAFPLQKNNVGKLRVPQRILDSPLMKRGGFDVFKGLADEYIKSSLLAEAIGQQKFAAENIVSEPDEEQIRGGAPPRSFTSSPGGSFQQQFYHSGWLIDFLRNLTTPFLAPTGDNGTYSYYLRPGDFLDLHRDIITCDVAVITCLKNKSAGNKSGGQLRLYPGRQQEPLSAIRSTPMSGAVDITLEEAQTIVMYGGLIPHALSPLGYNRQRIISVLCYAAL